MKPFHESKFLFFLKLVSGRSVCAAQKLMHFMLLQAHHVTVIVTLDKQTNKTEPPTSTPTLSTEKKDITTDKRIQWKNTPATNIGLNNKEYQTCHEW